MQIVVIVTVVVGGAVVVVVVVGGAAADHAVAAVLSAAVHLNLSAMYKLCLTKPMKLKTKSDVIGFMT